MKHFNSTLKKALSTLMFAALLGLSSCSHGPGEYYNKTAFKEDLKRIESKGMLDSSEIALISMYVSLGEIAGTSFEGRTYRQILKDAKAFEKMKRSRNISTTFRGE